MPPVLPNLKYDLPETTVQNYSPGTSLVFNAYKGHASLLAQPYHAREDDDSGYRDHRMIQSPSERDHPHRPPSDNAYPRRSSDFYPDYPDEFERRGRYNASPGRMDREPTRDQGGPDNRAPPPPEYCQPPRPPHHPHSQSHPSHLHPRPPMPYYEPDHPTEGTQHNYNSSHYDSRSDPYYPHHEGPWTSEHRPHSAAIAIPQPNQRFPPNYDRSTSGTQGYRDIDRNPQQNGRLPNYQPYDRSSHPMPSGSRAPTGPRYALSQVNYRMVSVILFFGSVHRQTGSRETQNTAPAATPYNATDVYFALITTKKTRYKMQLTTNSVLFLQHLSYLCHDAILSNA